METVRIPKDRVAVLIGKDGEVRREIEQRTGAKLKIDSESGEISINTNKVFEPIFNLTVIEMVRAIGRGLAPEKAFRLLQDDVYFRMVDMKEYSGRNKNKLARMRSRIIGTKGKTRHTIETITGVDISIQGNTIVLVGEIFELDIAETAIDMLLNGADHSTVYRFLDNKRRDVKMSRLE